MNRRNFIIKVSLAVTGFSLIVLTPSFAQNEITIGDDMDIDWKSITDEQWKERLTTEQYYILRESGTERPGSSSLNKEYSEGVYHCAGCDTALFLSETKYYSGTGWPSFYDFIPGSLGTKPDNSFFMRRTEYHCSTCLGHQGHVFADGPQPTGLRYCNNGDGLVFKPMV